MFKNVTGVTFRQCIYHFNSLLESCRSSLTKHYFHTLLQHFPMSLLVSSACHMKYCTVSHPITWSTQHLPKPCQMAHSTIKCHQWILGLVRISFNFHFFTATSFTHASHYLQAITYDYKLTNLVTERSLLMHKWMLYCILQPNY